MSWITALADHLSTNNLGVQGTSLFIGQLPDNDVLSSALTEYEGSFTETFESGMALSEPQLQIRVRGLPEDYLTPRNRMLAIQQLLNEISNTTIGGVAFLRVRPTSTMLALGQDDRLRWGFSTNFAVTIEGI